MMSCNYFSKKQVEERIDTGLKEANSQLEIDYKNATGTFELMYQNSIVTTKDSIRHDKILSFHSGVMSTVNFIDKLKTKLETLDKDDSHSIKRMFLTEKVTDTLFEKVNLSYILAEELALTEDQKSAIKKQREDLADWDKTKDQVFNMIGPEGTLWFLYSLETELLRTSSLTLKNN